MTEADNLNRCPHRPACDGCPNFEAEPLALFDAKVAGVAEQLAMFAMHSWPAPTIVAPGRSLAYRNRARMIVTTDGQLGLYRAGSREVVPIAACRVHEPAVESVLAQVRSARIDGAGQVDVRANADGGAIVTFGFDAAVPPEQLAKLRALASPSLAVHTNVGDKHAFMSGVQTRIEGADTLAMRVGEHVFEVPPTAFFQVNTEVLLQMHGVIAPWVAGGELLWDIHCGVGVHGISCASPGQTVRGSDIDPSGVEAAVHNATANDVAATFTAVSDDALELGEGAGNAILNPARAGLAWSLPEKLGAANIKRLAYVSCDARTFLRDAERLENAGFALRELHAFDMMPRTAHIELVGLFERSDSPRRWQTLGDGVTGVAKSSGPQLWVALISGSVPKRATLPGGQVTLERLRSVDGASVVRLQAPESVDANSLRALLKRWNHAVLGDDRMGVRSANFRLRNDAALDVPALHRLRSGGAAAPVPDFLLTLFRLPRDVIQRSTKR